MAQWFFKFVNYKKGAFDSQPQVIKFTSCLPMVGGSLCTPASSTTKTGRHDIAEILLKVALKHQKSNHDSEVETTDMYWSENTTFSGNFVLFY